MIKKIKNKKILFVALAVVLVASVAGFAYSQKTDDTPAKQPAKQTPPADKINFDPPTPQEQQSVEANKQALAEKNRSQPQQPVTGTKNITPVITYAGQYGSQVEVGAYVPGIYEDGGTCTATFIKDTKYVSRSVTAIKNVSSTDCPAMVVSNNEFSPKGTWQVTVSYDSRSSSGKSETKAIEVR